MNQALFACRIKAHSSTGLSPFYLVYGLEPAIPGDCTNPQITLEYHEPATAENWRLQQIRKLELEREDLIERNIELQLRSKKAFEEANNTSRRYENNELVYLRREARGKWENHWDGPFRTSEVGDLEIYKLADLDGKGKDGWIHGDRLKPVAKLPGTEVYYCTQSNETKEHSKEKGNVVLGYK